MSIVVSLVIKRVLTAFNSIQMIASKNQPVKWTSPVGLPVVQPYKKYKNYMVCFLSMTADVFVALSFFLFFCLLH
jgi:DNA-directed RNA polymerase